MVLWEERVCQQHFNSELGGLICSWIYTGKIEVLELRYQSHALAVV